MNVIDGKSAAVLNMKDIFKAFSVTPAPSGAAPTYVDLHRRQAEQLVLLRTPTHLRQGLHPSAIGELPSI